MGARSLRRLGTTLVVGPDTDLRRLLELRGRLQAWAAAQPLVQRDKVDVHIHRLTSSGVELSLTLFLAGATPAEEVGFRDALHCEMLAAIEALGVSIAPLPRAVLFKDAEPAARAA
jgi:hypothetical protein